MDILIRYARKADDYTCYINADRSYIRLRDGPNIKLVVILVDWIGT